MRTCGIRSRSLGTCPESQHTLCYICKLLAPGLCCLTARSNVRLNYFHSVILSDYRNNRIHLVKFSLQIENRRFCGRQSSSSHVVQSISTNLEMDEACGRQYHVKTEMALIFTEPEDRSSNSSWQRSPNIRSIEGLVIQEELDKHDRMSQSKVIH